jgi:hypothetical protein
VGFTDEAEMVFTTLSSSGRGVFAKLQRGFPLVRARGGRAALEGRGRGPGSGPQRGAGRLVAPSLAKRERPCADNPLSKRPRIPSPRPSTHPATASPSPPQIVTPPMQRAQVLIDEAAQAAEVAGLQPLVYGASNVVLVGDPQQVGPGGGGGGVR